MLVFLEYGKEKMELIYFYIFVLDLKVDYKSIDLGRIVNMKKMLIICKV